MSEEEQVISEVARIELPAEPTLNQEERDFLNERIGKIRRVYFLFNEHNSTVDIPEVSERLKIPGAEAASYCNAMVLLGLLKVERSLVGGVGGREINRNHFSRSYSQTSI